MEVGTRVYIVGGPAKGLEGTVLASDDGGLLVQPDGWNDPIKPLPEEVEEATSAPEESVPEESVAEVTTKWEDYKRVLRTQHVAHGGYLGHNSDGTVSWKPTSYIGPILTAPSLETLIPLLP